MEDRKITIHDVAAQAGVSIATISRVVHGLPVNAKTRLRVEQTISEMQYAPNLAARALKTRSSKTIACSTHGMLRSAVTPLLASIERTVRAAGYTLVLIASEPTPEGQRQAFRLLASRGLDGLIFSGPPGQDEATNLALGTLGIPTVLLDRDPTVKVDAVAVSHANAVQSAVHHLHSLGHERIALLTVSCTMLPGRERIAGYKRGLKECKLKFNKQWFSDRCTDDSSTFQQASQMMSLADRPTAVIAGGQSLLPSVLRAIRLQNLAVGRDVSVVAGCDSELAELATPGITSTRWDLDEWGRVATEVLLERIRTSDQGPGRRVIMPTELVVRDSTKPPRKQGAR